jgi:hypothetical protein
MKFYTERLSEKQLPRSPFLIRNVYMGTGTRGANVPLTQKNPYNTLFCEIEPFV